jgi:hypothetical protein
MRTHNRLTLVGAACFAGALLGGCSAAATGGGGPSLAVPTITASPAPTSYYAVEMAQPLAAYETSQSEEVTVADASGLLISSCLQKSGYDIPASEFSAQNGTPDVTEFGPYGFVDPNHGTYGLRLHAVASPAGDGSIPLPGGQAEEKKSSQCEQASMAQLGDNDADSALINNLISEAQSAAGTDPRVTAASSAWSQCMKQNGFSYSDPAAVASAVSPARTASASSSEIAVAEADWSCTNSTDLSGIYFAVEAGYQDELIQENIQQLTSVKKDVQTELAKAASVIAGGGA